MGIHTKICDLILFGVSLVKETMCKYEWYRNAFYIWLKQRYVEECSVAYHHCFW